MSTEWETAPSQPRPERPLSTQTARREPELLALIDATLGRYAAWRAQYNNLTKG